MTSIPNGVSQYREIPLALKMIEVSKTFARRNGICEEVFHNFSLTIAQDQVVSFLGTSGCGKTTLLNLITGILKADNGTIIINPACIKIGYMFQNDRLLPWRNAISNALVGAEIMNSHNKPEIRGELNEYLDKLGLKGSENKFPSMLSGGMRQRIALIRTLLCKPDLLLLDEPFSSLDFETRHSLENEVLHYALRNSATVLFVTHDIDEAIAVGGRLVILTGNPTAGRYTRIREDIPICFDSDSGGRDVVYVRQDPRFIEYRKIAWDKLRGPQL